MFTNSKKFNKTTLSSALVLALAAGTGMAVAAAPGEKDQNPDKRATPQGTTQNTRDINRQRDYDYKNAPDTELLHFAASDTLIGSDLRSTTGDDLGDINDFIVDRGSGRIAFAIISSGDFLGLGGKHFALPYGQLRFVAPNNEYSTQMTQQQIERQTEFLPENWNDLTKISWMDKITGWGDDQDSYAKHDQLMNDQLKSADRQDIKGTITKVDQRSEHGNDVTVIWVSDKDAADSRTSTNDRNNMKERTNTRAANGTREIVLGPTWYVMGMDSTVKVGDPVELSVVDYEGGLHALSGTTRGQQLRLRDSDGKGYWDASDQQGKRYILLSQLNGHQVEIAGSTAGEVQNTVVEAPSGYVAFIGLDPNDNLFGMGDDISLIPWSAVRIGPKLDVAINGSNTQVERTLLMPDDLTTLRTPSSVAQAYSAFGYNMPSFTPRDREDRDMRNVSPDHNMNRRDMNDRDGMKNQDRDDMSKTGDAWSRDSKWTKAFAKGDKVTVKGVYRGMKSMSLDAGAPEAQVLIVDTDDGRKNLILGPSWYVDRQKVSLNNGDKIEVVGRKANYNGADWIAAWSVQHESDSWTFWNDKTPAWSK